MGNEILQEKGRLLGFTDGYCRQYKCANAVYFMSLLAVKHSIAIDCGISAPSHGKSIVDAMNSVDKNMITQKSIKQVQSAEDALNPESTSLRIQTINNVEG